MFRSVASTSQGSVGTSRLSSTILLPTGDSIPLLNHSKERHIRRKPFYRPRPIWLVPFAIISSVVRGMTIAPRVQVYTQLSCNRLYGRHDWNHTQHTPSMEPLSSYTTLFTAVDPFVPHHPQAATLPVHDVISDSAIVSDDRISMGARKRSRTKTQSGCAFDPKVQAGAARLQTVMTTTVGLLSAATSGWWGVFSERHGRTKVLAISTLGLLLTDLTFVLVLTPALPFFPHGHKLLIVGPIVEGLLGGLSTLQASTSSYLSDCTPVGTRSQIFSCFTGVFYIGFFIGPSIAGYLVHHPLNLLGLSLSIGSAGIDLSPFWMAIVCSFVNFVMALFVFPESLRKEKRARARARWEDSKVGGDTKGKVRMAPPIHDNEVLSGIGSIPVIDYVDRADEDVANFRGARGGILTQLLSPLTIFLPATVPTPGITRKRRDWTLTLVATGFFAYTMSTGIFQMKYLYATHTYGWGVRKLSYYISLMGGLKVLFLLLILPSIIAVFKPRQPVKGITSSRPIQSFKGKEPVTNTQSTLGTSSKKPKFNRAQLGQEISFDITLARLSLLIDIIAHSLVAISPSPAIVLLTKPHGCCDLRPVLREASFIVASGLNSFGAGLTPSVHSLALSVTQLRVIDGKNSGVGANEDDSPGELFGALAALQAIGQTILAPMLFGMIYGGTVTKFPKAIFVISATLCVFALVMFSWVGNPVVKVGFKGKAPIKRRRDNSELLERGRSRVNKDLRGGAIPYNPRQSYGAVAEGVAESV